VPPINTESKSALRIKFFELLFEGNEGYVCIATTLADLPKASFKQRFFSWPFEHQKMENFILSIEKKHNVYFGVNLLSDRERKKGNCLPTNLLWSDLDATPLSKLQQIPPPILIETSPGRHQAIWRVSAELPAYQAEDYSRRIAYYVDADASGWDLTQLLRVPFTKNYKYVSNPDVTLIRAGETTVPSLIFEKLPAIEAGNGNGLATTPMPTELPALDRVLYKYHGAFKQTAFHAIYSYEPTADEDWSRTLWRLIHIGFEAGMSPEEVFVVANAAPSNKYERDGRPLEHLWREVLKAEVHQRNVFLVDSEWQALTMPVLVEAPASGTFLDSYRDWAKEATDAVVQFHDLACMIVLSSIVANSVRLHTSYGTMVPNLWGLILGDSTLTRKTTAMTMATEFLIMIEPELIMATDGSAEGLLTGLSMRPNKVSIFYRDEVSGFFDSINKRDYLAGMPETLTHLYDVPAVYTRRLRKETIHLESPAFVFFGGGVRDRVYEAVTEEYVVSGFLPRFLVVSGDTQLDQLRRTGPATELGTEKRTQIANFFMDLQEIYGTNVTINIGGQPVQMPARISAILTPDAWSLYGDFEERMVNEASESSLPSLALPTFERLSRSLLKIAVIFAATRQTPEDNVIKVEETDVVNAAWYVQDWGRYSVELVVNAGKRTSEKLLDKIVRVITEHPGILRSTIMKHYHLSKREADDILSTLEDRQLVRKEKAGSGWRYYLA
jgi:Protein of unknown function (DUF3987)/RepB DNA-primase from phage plasmid